MNKLIAFTKPAVLFLCCSLLSFFSFAQVGDNDTAEMADIMRSNGKIYVVVTVCLIILIGLFLYVIRVENKLKKLEKESKSNSDLK